jgi:hypothetical protein
VIVGWKEVGSYEGRSWDGVAGWYFVSLALIEVKARERRLL